VVFFTTGIILLSANEFLCSEINFIEHFMLFADSRSSQRFSICTNFEFTRTYSSQQTSPGEQEEEHEKSRTICETRELAQDSRQDYPDFISSDFRPRSNVLTKRTTMNCPHCHKEIDLNPRPVCSGRTNNPTEHDSRTEGQPNTPSEHAENID